MDYGSKVTYHPMNSKLISPKNELLDYITHRQSLVDEKGSFAYMPQIRSSIRKSMQFLLPWSLLYLNNLISNDSMETTSCSSDYQQCTIQTE